MTPLSFAVDAYSTRWSRYILHTDAGDLNLISGTCDIANVCTDRPIASPNFNVRCHVLPGRWLTFFVLNAGGEALDWFRRIACSELGDDEFYAEYVPRVLDEFFRGPDPDAREAELPEYVPYLGGSRYSLERLTAGLNGLTLETTREDLLLQRLDLAERRNLVEKLVVEVVLRQQVRQIARRVVVPVVEGRALVRRLEHADPHGSGQPPVPVDPVPIVRVAEDLRHETGGRNLGLQQDFADRRLLVAGDAAIRVNLQDEQLVGPFFEADVDAPIALSADRDEGPDGEAGVR